jgi:hypothetical protein
MLDVNYSQPQPKIISGAKGDWELVIGMENFPPREKLLNLYWIN